MSRSKRKRRQARAGSSAQPFSMPPLEVTPTKCGTCGAFYLDTDPGRQAHVVVFGHRPRKEEANRIGGVA